MKSTKGYYSIIQYCPDHSRGEAANIGALLFCPELGFLKAKLSRGNQRIRKFFGAEGHDWKQINAYKRALRDRLQTRTRKLQTIDDLENFIALRANEITITRIRTIRVTDPELDLTQLFDQLVGKTPDALESKSFKRYLSEKLSSPLIAKKIIHDIHVTVPVFDKEVEIPFGYQNGRFNLINPVTFEAKDMGVSLRTACTYAVEGQSLSAHRHPDWGHLQLLIVGQFRQDDQETPHRIRRVFDEYGVRLYMSDEVPKLIDEIHRTGKVITS